MPFADYTFYKSNPAITVVQNNNDPFSGDGGALEISNAGLEISSPINAVNGHLSTAIAGQTVGFIRTEIYVSDHTLDISREGEYGIYCMADSLDLANLSGKAYAFVIHFANVVDWRIVEYTNGIGQHSVPAPPIIHEQGSSVISPGVGKTLLMQFAWTLDVEGIGGIRLHAQVAEGTDSALLEDVYDITLGSGILDTSVQQGLLYADLEGGTGAETKRVWFINTFTTAYDIVSVG